MNQVTFLENSIFLRGLRRSIMFYSIAPETKSNGDGESILRLVFELSDKDKISELTDTVLVDVFRTLIPEEIVKPELCTIHSFFLPAISSLSKDNIPKLRGHTLSFDFNSLEITFHCYDEECWQKLYDAIYACYFAPLWKRLYHKILYWIYR